MCRKIRLTVSGVLVLQDTTELNYSGQKKKQGVGPRRHEAERDLFIHPQLVISESGICLGIYDDYQWFRKELKHRVMPLIG